ncbi:MAG TPA: glycosyl hydrolase 108 family protein [Amaricoccus sp.]|uniref:glycoside hydrolase family 108 protein n=1 Tax=Amaricoccus sp. TaxID=1872485 RepID=UPI002B951291|nr:glycosyl hydrolase 108 family protein [Amaricoccus sp.]HMQ93533.1 glycosyl hydrolase 108 family protein [Amaricoccus sp.]HMR53470.1 glycosyl hydrolase 108 family protein [Amaricoccus sp.]HMR58953.1 glycosyl hydrolase 108 family protein [Amaricoccus sp.]HMU00472.1 glycosyl hydrolase 108 family protein [Amaricoccus sp.]
MDRVSISLAQFRACHAVTAKWEGGKVDHPKDPGGRTAYGVTQRVYDAYRRGRGLATRDVYSIDQDEVHAIYLRDYWAASGAGRLAPGYDLVVYDASVNSGVGRGPRWFQSAVGVAPDGKIGTKTIAAAQAAKDGVAVIQRACAARLGFLKGLGTWRTFGRGWANRVSDIEARAAKMWLAATGRPVAETLRNEGNKAAATARKDATAAAGAAGGSAAASTQDAVTTLPLSVLAVAGVIVAVVIVIAALRSANNRSRARAYARAALEI